MVQRLALVCGVCLCAVASALSQQATPVAPKPAKTAYYIDLSVLDVKNLVPPPPQPGSSLDKQDMETVHQVEKARTAEQVTAAKADEAEESIFSFQSLFGSNFTPASLPLTAALGEHVKNEQGVVGSQLKQQFQRPRPYQTDSSLHPVCEIKTVHDSYPSGHGLTGYLEALTLAEMVPEKRDQILQRADEYAHNRVVCGVHYPSDTEASRRVAYIVFGYMLATPRFQRDLAQAKAELRKNLGLAAN